MSRRRRSCDSQNDHMTNIIVPIRGQSQEGRKTPVSKKKSKSAKSKKKASRSRSQAKKYQLSIDRIVQGNQLSRKKSRKSLPQEEKSKTAGPTRSTKKLKHARSSTLLPGQRVITPCRRPRTPLNNATSAGRSKNGEANRQQSTKQRKSAERLSGLGARSRTPASRKKSVTSRSAIKGGLHERLSASPTWRTPTRKAGHQQSVATLPDERRRVQIRQQMELNKQKASYEQQLRKLTTQTQSQIDLMKHSLDLERRKAAKYQETIREMHGRIEKVSAKNSELCRKVRKNRKGRPQSKTPRAKKQRPDSFMSKSREVSQQKDMDTSHGFQTLQTPSYRDIGRASQAEQENLFANLDHPIEINGHFDTARLDLQRASAGRVPETERPCCAHALQEAKRTTFQLDEPMTVEPARSHALEETKLTMVSQTSTSSTDWPDEFFNPVNAKFKKATKEIQRIERILYKNDKRVAKRMLAKDNIRRFNEKIASVANKKLNESIAASQSNPAEGRYDKQALWQDAAMRKIVKMGHIDRGAESQ